MHVRLYGKFPAAPAYVDPKLDNAGGDLDGDLSYMLKDLCSFLGRFLVCRPILNLALLGRVE